MNEWKSSIVGWEWEPTTSQCHSWVVLWWCSLFLFSDTTLPLPSVFQRPWVEERSEEGGGRGLRQRTRPHIHGDLSQDCLQRGGGKAACPPHTAYTRTCIHLHTWKRDQTASVGKEKTAFASTGANPRRASPYHCLSSCAQFGSLTSKIPPCRY